jgi:intracellular sulfur oxidation DsrE/DsrF family protein
MHLRIDDSLKELVCNSNAIDTLVELTKSRRKQKTIPVLYEALKTISYLVTTGVCVCVCVFSVFVYVYVCMCPK